MKLEEYNQIIISENIYQYGKYAVNKYLKTKRIWIYNKRFLDSEIKFDPIKLDIEIINFPMYYVENFIKENSIIVLTDEDFKHFYKVRKIYEKIKKEYIVKENTNIVYVVANGKKTICSNDVNDIIENLSYQEILNSGFIDEFKSYSNAIIILNLLLLETKKEMPKLIFNDMFDIKYLEN